MTLMQIPNFLTILRILLVPVLSAMIMFHAQPFSQIILALFIIAAATDFLDGWLARRWNATSELGRMLDPIADKLLVALPLLALAAIGELGMLGLISALAILFREVGISGIREHLAGRLVIHVSNLAKIKTTMQLFAIGAALAALIWPVLKPISEGLLGVAATLTLITGWQYYVAARAFLNRSD